MLGGHTLAGRPLGDTYATGKSTPIQVVPGDASAAAAAPTTSPSPALVALVPGDATATASAPSVVGLPLAGPPDSIANATKLATSSGTITGLDNTTATNEVGEPTTGGTLRPKSLWFWFTTTSVSATWQIDNTGSTPSFDSYLGLWRATAGKTPATVAFADLTNVTSDDDAGGNTLSKMTGTNLAAGTYFVNFASYSSAYSTSGGKLNWTGLSTAPATQQGAVTAVPGAASADESVPAVVGAGGGTQQGAVASVPITAQADEAPPAVIGLALSNVSASPGQATASTQAPTVSGLQLANVSGLPGQAAADQAAPIVTALQATAISSAPGTAQADLAPPSVAAGSRMIGSVTAASSDSTASLTGPVIGGRAAAQAVVAPAAADASGPSVAGGSRSQAVVSGVPGQASADLPAPGIYALRRVPAGVPALPGLAQADSVDNSVSGRAQVGSVVAQASADVAAASLAIKATVGAQPSLAAASIVAAIIGGRALVRAIAGAAESDVQAPRMRPSRDITLAATADPRRWSAELLLGRWAAELNPRRWTST